MQKTNTKNYIEPGVFFDEVLKCLKNGNKISDELQIMFQKLAEKYSNHRNFVRYYSLRDDLIATGVLQCVKSFEKFRPLKGEIWDGKSDIEYHYSTCNNPFAFFTTCIHNDFIHMLKKEYNQSNIVNEMRIAEGLDADFGYVEMMKNKEEEEKNERDDESSWE